MFDNEPSRTAEYMALFRAVETAEPPDRRLFEDPYAIPLLSGTLKVLAEIARISVVGKLVPAFLDFGWPHTRSSGVVRTRLIDDLVREAIHAGAQQLVLLGAGFDSRAYRLEETRDIRTFEVDHPATQRAKRERLKPRLQQPAVNVHFVEVDFEKDNLEFKLKEAGFDEKTPAVVLWEGVVSYLSEPAVDANLVVLARLLAPHSRLILTYVHKGALDGSQKFQDARRWRSWADAAVNLSSLASIPLPWRITCGLVGFCSRAMYPPPKPPEATVLRPVGMRPAPSCTGLRP